MYLFNKLGKSAAAWKAESASPHPKDLGEQLKSVKKNKQQDASAGAQQQVQQQAATGKFTIKAAGTIGKQQIRERSLSPTRQMLPQESPSNQGWLSGMLSKELMSPKKQPAFKKQPESRAGPVLDGVVVASYDCMLWEPSVELSRFPHQSLKTNSWKQMLRNPYTRVFALDFELAKSGEERFELSEYSALPNVECLSWEPSKPLSCFPHQSLKTNSWKQMLRNPYTRVFALDFEFAKRGEPRWTAKAEEWDCFDALAWEPSPAVAQRTVAFSSSKSNPWKAQLKNPYVYCFAYDFERAKSGEPRWM